ncbi:MAG: UDP-2,3-diacylglucosamine diphosphatase LpxI [Phycisphaerales bacterium]|nr:UDP-2,3-diacylglucosamine diphosphatase LpxI [Phycisphaerales bacterium]
MVALPKGGGGALGPAVTTSKLMAATLTILPDPPAPPTPIGLIAAGGRLPIMIAKGLAAAGHPIHALGLRNQYEPELPGLCTTFRKVGVLRVASWGGLLRKVDVRHAIMVGRIDKARLMYGMPWSIIHHVPDPQTLLAWFRHLRHDRRSHAVLVAVANELSRNGVHLIDSTAPIMDQLAEAGVMTKRQPTAQQRADIAFSWPLLSQTLRLDIGQAIAVRDRDIIAVEAVEGTDRMIERVGVICRATGWTLCKGARAGHDRRSDVPTVGPATIEMLYKHGGRCLALAAGDVIMIDKPQLLELADQLGVSVIGVAAAQA